MWPARPPALEIVRTHAGVAPVSTAEIAQAGALADARDRTAAVARRRSGLSACNAPRHASPLASATRRSPARARRARPRRDGLDAVACRGLQTRARRHQHPHGRSRQRPGIRQGRRDRITGILGGRRASAAIARRRVRRADRRVRVTCAHLERHRGVVATTRRAATVLGSASGPHLQASDHNRRAPPGARTAACRPAPQPLRGPADRCGRCPPGRSPSAPRTGHGDRRVHAVSASAPAALARDALHRVGQPLRPTSPKVTHPCPPSLSAFPYAIPLSAGTDIPSSLGAAPRAGPDGPTDTHVRGRSDAVPRRCAHGPRATRRRPPRHRPRRAGGPMRV